jgi:hypothetical protein
LKKPKLSGWILLAVFGVALLGYGILRYFATAGYPIVGGGSQTSPDGRITANSFAIVERPFWGKEHRYYRFELVEGGPGGRVLKFVIMEPLPGEDFRMPRRSPAFPAKWSGDFKAATFSGQGMDLTLYR